MRGKFICCEGVEHSKHKGGPFTSQHRLAIVHAMFLKEIGDVLALGKVKATIGTIFMDFKAQKLSGGT